MRFGANSGRPKPGNFALSAGERARPGVAESLAAWLPLSAVWECKSQRTRLDWYANTTAHETQNIEQINRARTRRVCLINLDAMKMHFVANSDHPLPHCFALNRSVRVRSGVAEWTAAWTSLSVM